MAKERKNINLKVLDEMPGHPFKKWQIRFQYTVTTKKRANPEVNKVTYVGTVEQARAERDHLRHYLKQGLDPDDFPRPHEQKREPREGSPTAKTDRDHVTFGELRHIHKKHRDMELDNERTKTTENNALKNRILPEIGDWVVQRVTLRDFQDLRLRWYQRHVDVPEDHPEKLSPATINKWIRIMKTFVGWCARRQGVAHPCRDLKALPKPKKKQGRAMSRDELDKLLTAIQKRYPHYHALCYMAAYTGQRFGTLAFLKWEHIDPTNNRIKLHNVKTGHKTSAPFERFRDVLTAHKEVMEDWSPIAFKKSPYVFPKLDGEMRTGTSAIGDALERACEDAEIPRVTFHDFRRTFVTIALDNGVAPDVIKSMTGHCSEMIGYYHHQSDGGKDDLIGVVMGDANQEANDDADNQSDSVVTASDVL